MNAMSAIPQAENGHLPVMLDEVIAHLQPRDGGVYLDGTFGGGGYARAILGAARCTLWGIDRDPDAIARGQAIAANQHDDSGAERLRMVEGAFGDLDTLLDAAGLPRSEHGALDGAVFDLGVSSFQLDQAERGFSFRTDGPLDMRMSRNGPTAADLVNTLPEAELADTIYQYGEERLSRRIARAIVAARAEAPFETTLQLAGVIRRVMPSDRSGIDPATRSFQALRIRVNDELGQIERGLAHAAALLRPGGRLVVVSFHSGEDRIVKRFMLDAAGRTPAPSRHDPRAQLRPDAPSPFRLMSARALRPGETETRRNPRARSARLRALERLDRPQSSPQMPGEAR